MRTLTEVTEAIKVEIYKIENDPTYEISEEADSCQAEIIQALEDMGHPASDEDTAAFLNMTPLEIWKHHINVMIPLMAFGA